MPACHTVYCTFRNFCVFTSLQSFEFSLFPSPVPIRTPRKNRPCIHKGHWLAHAPCGGGDCSGLLAGVGSTIGTLARNGYCLLHYHGASFLFHTTPVLPWLGGRGWCCYGVRFNSIITVISSHQRNLSACSASVMCSLWNFATIEPMCARSQPLSCNVLGVTLSRCSAKIICATSFKWDSLSLEKIIISPK